MRQCTLNAAQYDIGGAGVDAAAVGIIAAQWRRGAKSKHPRTSHYAGQITLHHTTQARLHYITLRWPDYITSHYAGQITLHHTTLARLNYITLRWPDYITSHYASQITSHHTTIGRAQQYAQG